MSTAVLERLKDPSTGRFVPMPEPGPQPAEGFTPVRVYHLKYPGCTLVDRGIQQGRENKDWDPAASREFLFQDSYYQAMNPEDLATVLRIGGPDVAVEDLPEGLEQTCPFCERQSRCRAWMRTHITNCPAQFSENQL